MSFLTGAATNTVAFVLVLGVMISFHEFGHFITAKAFGMRVFIFSLGFGRRLFGFHWGETDCRVSLIPLGGYVKLEGEPEDQLSEDTSTLGDGKDFTTRPRWQRFIVYLAGPVMNGVLTVGILTTLYMAGFQVEASRYDRPIVGAVGQGSAAEAAGIQPGDEILSIDGKALPNWEEAEVYVLMRPEQTLKLRIRRGGEEREVTARAAETKVEKVGSLGVYPLVRVGEVMADGAARAAGMQADDAVLRIGEKPIHTFSEIPALLAGSAGKELTFQVWREGRVFDLHITPRDSGGAPRIGITPKMAVKRFGPVEAFVEALQWSWNMTRQTFEVLGRLLTAQISPKTMMGPLGIAKASGDAARGGPGALFFLVAVISLQVGIMNLFPLPPLDGGHLAILLGEGIIRRDFSLTVKYWIMNTGVMVLFLLIGVVLYSDLSKTTWLGQYLP